MRRFTRTENDDEDDEEQLYERKALIDDDELNQDEASADLMSTSSNAVRQRQSAGKHKTNSNSSSNHNSRSEFELKSLNGTSRTRDLISEPFVEFTYYDIQPGDSLQSICLRYACSVNQVKRLNGLMTDQEFYGLRKIKLPLGKLGLLEDILEHQKSPQFEDTGATPINNTSRPRMVNSPGSALSVSTRHVPHFKPLLSPGFSSDNIIELGRARATSRQNNFFHHNQTNGGPSIYQHNHSHSFSSLREFAHDSDHVTIVPHLQQQANPHLFVDTRQLAHKSFIKSDLPEQDPNVEDLVSLDGQDQVGKVFEDLDYHVDRARAAAETYDQRAADIVDRIETNGTSTVPSANFGHTSVSKIPQLFFCNENFGLNFKKLVVVIFVVCLVVPLIFIRQSNAVAMEL